ncbi:hypothetical protein LX83_006589 [Goodfellowiella coeruleoviolacea]|uniref:Uncharacterized protein n=1 Tax=Goodfellowiella coeruleoviolacea TaxID=334858 RepID=A0AAE3KPC9_9PSEU|nr:hypothetical protein [Goodfellowiella coeruleoviolacea]
MCRSKLCRGKGRRYATVADVEAALDRWRTTSEGQHAREMGRTRESRSCPDGGFHIVEVAR